MELHLLLCVNTTQDIISQNYKKNSTGNPGISLQHGGYTQ